MQILGYGWAGMLRRYLVDPIEMWWPANLAQVSLFRSVFLLWSSQFPVWLMRKTMERKRKFEHLNLGLFFCYGSRVNKKHSFTSGN